MRQLPGAWATGGSPRWVMAGPAGGHWGSPRHRTPPWGWGQAEGGPGLVGPMARLGRVGGVLGAWGGLSGECKRY